MLKKLINNSSKIAIFSHANPDGDTIGSSLALKEILKKLNKEVHCFSPHIPSKIFNFVSEIDSIKNNFKKENYDLIIFVDFSPYNRISKFTKHKEDFFDKKNLIIIDHHKGPTPDSATLIIKDESAISTCEIIYEEIMKNYPKLIDKKIADYLLLGILTDSGSFHYDEGKESIRVLKIAKELLELGANKKYIIDNFFYSRTLESVKFANILIERMKIEDNILHTYFLDNELEKNNVDEEEAKLGYTDILRKIQGPELYILARKKETTMKFSLRSTGSKKFHCGEISLQFGGGGHRGAAGFSVDLTKDFEIQKQEVIEKIKKSIQ